MSVQAKKKTAKRASKKGKPITTRLQFNTALDEAFNTIFDRIHIPHFHMGSAIRDFLDTLEALNAAFHGTNKKEAAK